jgi:putative hydrolase of the HAD superfamily
MAINAVIFDCFGVLVASARNILHQEYPQSLQEMDNIEHESDYGMISRSEVNQALSKITGLSPETLEKKYWSSSVRNEKAIDWVRDLKKSGKYKMGMLSNIGGGWINDFLPVTLQKELFDEVILSSDVGMIKPEIAVYLMMAKRLGVKPDECVMIDDKPINIDGAVDAGMQGVVFRSLTLAQDDFAKLLESNNG